MFPAKSCKTPGAASCNHMIPRNGGRANKGRQGTVSNKQLIKVDDNANVELEGAASTCERMIGHLGGECMGDQMLAVVPQRVSEKVAVRFRINDFYYVTCLDPRVS